MPPHSIPERFHHPQQKCVQFSPHLALGNRRFSFSAPGPAFSAHFMQTEAHGLLACIRTSFLFMVI